MSVKGLWFFLRIWTKLVQDIILEKVPNIQFQENPSIESRDVPYGQRDRQTDTTKFTVAFLNRAKAPKTEMDIMSLPTRESR
jgi:hypothetical protein